MVNYRRMGNMEMHLGNTTQTPVAEELINTIWKSPRWTVYYIRALAVVAVISAYLCIGFGLCRRSSNRWIVHKGFFAAAALSVSLGTYNIGLMQSSRVKSEMYPVWTVSLFALYNCIDPVTAYSGFDYKGPLLKMVFGICLNCGYVLLMIVSANSSYTGNTTIVLLSVITFVKGFHRSLALVQQSRMRNMIQNNITDQYPDAYVLKHSTQIGSEEVIVDFPTRTGSRSVTMEDIASARYTGADEQAIEELRSMCVAFSLSHKLQHTLVLGYHAPNNDKNYLQCWSTSRSKWNKMVKMIETELAFLYDIFFTGNVFHQYYQAKAASLWALASFIGICSVGIAVAVAAAATPTPDSMAMTGHLHGGSTNLVDTTTADLVITFGILVSLALLQLMHLIQCWTSNWARLAVACAYATEKKKEREGSVDYEIPYWRARWLRLKLSVATSINLFDKHLWKNKIGQYSELPEGRLARKKEGEQSSERKHYLKSDSLCLMNFLTLSKVVQDGVKGTMQEFGLDYIKEALWDLLGRGINKIGAVSLDDDVKECIADFVFTEIYGNTLENGWRLPSSYSSDYHPLVHLHLPYIHGPGLVDGESHGYRYTRFVMLWHAATLYCEQVEQEREKKKEEDQAEEGRTCCWGSAAREELAKQPAEPESASESDTAAREELANKPESGSESDIEESIRLTRDQNRRVANALSKYCAYLVVSAPELLPGPAAEATRAYKKFVNTEVSKELDMVDDTSVTLAKMLLGDYPRLRHHDPWKALASLWVRMLVYAAPYGDMQAHMQRLTQGGEFITHLWALFIHLNVREWKLPASLVRNIIDEDDANRVLTDGFRAVVFFDSEYDSFSEDLATASRLVGDVGYYWTSNPDVARVFEIPVRRGGFQRQRGLIFLNENLKPAIILYDGEFSASGIACFVWNKCREDREATTEMINSNSREAANSPSSSD